eukprot:1148570-Pelagomonas_calceolata.AAC.2
MLCADQEVMRWRKPCSCRKQCVGESDALQEAMRWHVPQITALPGKYSLNYTGAFQAVHAAAGNDALACDTDHCLTFLANTPCTTLVRSRQSMQLMRITPFWFFITFPVCVFHWWNPMAANSSATCTEKAVSSAAEASGADAVD